MVLRERAASDEATDARSRERLRRVGAWFRSVGAGKPLRHVDYAQAEEDSRILAGKVRQALGSDALAEARFLPIPRGGFFVLGMAAYWLGLDFPMLRPAETPRPDAPTLLFDDCAFSGHRIRQTLQRIDRRGPVAICLLYAPEALAEAVEAAEEGVRVVVARWLADSTAERFPDPQALAKWRAAWKAREGYEERYWLGASELVTFAWSEPDRPFFNPETKRVESGWHVLPPHLSLKSRAGLAADLPGCSTDGGHGRWLLNPDVVWGDFDGEVWMVRGDEEVFSLAGPARLMWKATLSGCEPEQVGRLVAERYDVSPEAARSHCETLLEDLRRASLFTERPSPQSP